jgi:hypothetical protein
MSESLLSPTRTKLHPIEKKVVIDAKLVSRNEKLSKTFSVSLKQKEGDCPKKKK